MVFWYFEYFNFNMIGLRLMRIIMWVVIVGVVKKIVFRLLILVVFMGFGVVCFIFGGLILKVLFLGVIYFLVVEFLDVVENVNIINDFFGKERLFLVLLVVMFDVFFILWIFIFLL